MDTVCKKLACEDVGNIKGFIIVFLILLIGLGAMAEPLTIVTVIDQVSALL